MTRNDPASIDNSEYLAYVRQSYLSRLKENLPRTILEKDSWLTPPPVMREVSDLVVFRTQSSRWNKKHPVKILNQVARHSPLHVLQVSQCLQKIYIRNLVRKYVRGLTPQRKAQVPPTI